MGFLAVMQGQPDRIDGKNRFFLFRRSMEIADADNNSRLAITVDGRYQLFVNGQRIGRGPVRCSPLYQRFDEYDLSPYLRSGRNVIAVLVHNYGVDTAFYEGVKGMWRPTFGEGGLWACGNADGEIIDSDHRWRCVQCDAWKADTPRMNSGLGFIEDLDARMLPFGWCEPDFDDDNWSAARPLISGGGGPEAMFGGIETRPFPTLIPRGIPPLNEALLGAQRILWTAGHTPSPDLPVEARIYNEALCVLPEGAIRDNAGLLKVHDATTIITTSPDADIGVVLDFGTIITGCPRIEVIALGDEIIEIAASEKLPGEWAEAGPLPLARITPEPLLGLDAHVSRYTARPGHQIFERFEWCAIRYLHVVVRNAPGGLTIKGLGATTLNYPVRQRGRFACSDATLTRLWEVGAYTLRQCMHDAWEDCPGREQRQWLGDATVENLSAIAAFGDDAAALNRKFLEQVAESQRPDGLTQMFAPGDHATNGLLIPDWTLQWILNAGDHYLHTGNLDVIERIFPAIQKALAWFERQIGADDLVVNMPYWHFMDWAGLGRSGEAATLNAQLAGAYRVAATLASALDWQRAADRYRNKAELLSSALQARHWDDRRGIYVDIVDPNSGSQDLRTSQHANAAIALWGCPPPERIARALDRVTERDRLTFTAAPPIVPTGAQLDPENGVVLANTFYAHFVYEALAMHGRLPAAHQLMRDRFGPMLDRGATTLWESFEPTASLCHGFSASPTWQLSRYVLGIHPRLPGYAAIAATPDLGDLEWAEGIFPAPTGDILVRLDRADQGFTAMIEADANLTITIGEAVGCTLIASHFDGTRHHCEYRRK
jgi:alpha-L-rhamnosidase